MGARKHGFPHKSITFFTIHRKLMINESIKKFVLKMGDGNKMLKKVLKIHTGYVKI